MKENSNLTFEVKTKSKKSVIAQTEMFGQDIAEAIDLSEAFR